MPRNKVAVKGYKADGKLAYEQYLSIHAWYDSTYPLLDDEGAVRVKYGITRLEGIHFDSEGQAVERWRNIYSDSGQIVKSSVWFVDGTMQVGERVADGPWTERSVESATQDLPPEF